MIREYLGKKAAERIDRSKYADTRTGKVAATILDNERLLDLGSDNLVSLSDNADHPFFRARIVGLATVSNLVSYFAVFIIPGIVEKLVLGLSLILPIAPTLLLAPAFGFTMLATYSTLRIKFPENHSIPQQGEVMQSYGTQSESLLTWKLWVVSCGVGGVNAFVLAITYLYMTDGWS